MDDITLYLANQLAKAIDIIDNSGLQFIEYGLFGSCARGEYTGSSDIDIVIITKEPFINHELSELRCILEELNCDITNITQEHLLNPITAFHRSVARDYRRIKNG